MPTAVAAFYLEQGRILRRDQERGARRERPHRRGPRRPARLPGAGRGHRRRGRRFRRRPDQRVPRRPGPAGAPAAGGRRRRARHHQPRGQGRPAHPGGAGRGRRGRSPVPVAWTMELQIALDRIPLDRTPSTSPDPWRRWPTGSRSARPWSSDTASTGSRRWSTPPGGTPVLADLKTADDAAYEFALAYDAGAASATVLGLARRRHPRHRRPDRGRAWAGGGRGPHGAVAGRRAVLAARLPAHVVLAAHVGKDARASGLARSTCSARGPTAAGWRWRAASPLPTCPRSRTCPTCG